MPLRAARNRSYRAMAITWLVTTITASFYCLCAVFSIFKGVISLGVIGHFACMQKTAQSEIAVDTHVGRYYVSLAITQTTTVRDLVDQLPAEALEHWRGHFIFYKHGKLHANDVIHNVLGQNADSIDIVSFMEDTISGGY
jgi:hypothetical protein